MGWISYSKQSISLSISPRRTGGILLRTLECAALVSIWCSTTVVFPYSVGD